MNQTLIAPPNAPALTEREKVFVAVLELLGWHFGGLTTRGRGHRCYFLRGEGPLEAIHCRRGQLRAFTLRQLRNLP